MRSGTFDPPTHDDINLGHGCHYTVTSLIHSLNFQVAYIYCSDCVELCTLLWSCLLQRESTSRQYLYCTGYLEKMGNVFGKNARKAETDAAHCECVLVSNDSGDTGSLSFDPLQSYAVAFCINRQTAPQFQHKQLDDIVVNGARKIFSALQANGGVPRKNVKLIEAKLDPDSCTFAGMKRTFQEQAKMVGKGGILFLHFSGHGIKIGDDQFGLAPVDFDCTESLCITASVLSQWLNEVSSEAKCVVFTIDSCYAGGLAKVLTHDSNMLTPSPLYVMAACTANEKSFPIGTLQSTTYCYFLSHAIQMAECSPGNFPIKHIHEKCEKLTTALSSLVLTYDEAHGVISKTMHPELMQSKNDVKGKVQADGGTQEDTVGQQYSYVFELCDSIKGNQLAVLHENCCDWLESTCKDSNGGLYQLEKEGLLGHKQCVMDTVLCCMLHSVASIQLDCDSTTVASPNLFLTAYMQVVKAISSVCSGARFGLSQCILGLVYYRNNLHKQKIETLPLVQLYMKAKKLENSSGGIMADSGDSVSQLLLVTSLVFKNALQ